MKARAPGKLVLTGAYAVLEGAPAAVVAVDRYARADASRRADNPFPEVLVALGGEPAPHAECDDLRDANGCKLGLGSSAAVLVASLAARALAHGEDLLDAAVRARLFSRGRQAHALAQGGGSGVDVAASVYGGLLRYGLDSQAPTIRKLAWPKELSIQVYFGGSSAKTSDLLGRVASAQRDRPQEISPVMSMMVQTATQAADALQSADLPTFLSLAQEYGNLLAALGRAAGVPIVLPTHAALALDARREGAVFLPSGAGGGDVAVWIGRTTPSSTFSERARSFSLVRLALTVDTAGVQPDTAPS